MGVLIGSDGFFKSGSLKSVFKISPENSHAITLPKFKNNAIVDDAGHIYNEINAIGLRSFHTSRKTSPNRV